MKEDVKQGVSSPSPISGVENSQQVKLKQSLVVVHNQLCALATKLEETKHKFEETKQKFDPRKRLRRPNDFFPRLIEKPPMNKKAVEFSLDCEPSSLGKNP
jgi:hypothetical protein